MNDAVEVAVWWAAPLPPDDALLGLLDDAERGRFAAYRRLEDRQRFLTGRVLARTIVGQRLGAAPQDVVLDATCPDCGKPHGRPTVPGTELVLSISHAGERVGLAVADGVPVGLDVEALDRNSGPDLVRYSLTDVEQAAIAQLPEQQRATAFFTYWTRKEALMKATGRGLKLPLRSITLTPPGEPPRLLSSDDGAADPARVAFADLDPGNGYLAALAALTERPLKVIERQRQR